MSKPRIVVKMNEPRQTKQKWGEIRNAIDPDATHEEIIHMLHDYFSEDESRYDVVRRESRDPEFR